ncbi:MAG: type III-A CRISPR-associated RAMP protein Csm5 [Methanosphaera sp.]|nr:type III-A CRISPR-associated RAMP protein Csm5 [Methanosphaera sp.]
MKYNYNLSVLTPTHIGDGSSYSNKEYYVKEDNLYYKINNKRSSRKVNYIFKLNLNEYLKNISPENQEDFLNKLSKNTINNQEKEEIAFEKYIEKHPDIIKYYDYKTIEITKKVENDGIKHPTRINSTIKNTNNKAYIPGSSIKGAIRTAIIYDYLDKKNPRNQRDYEIICNCPEIDEIMKNISISDSSEYKNNIRTVQILPFTLTQEDDKNSNRDEKKGDMYNAIECIYNPYNLNVEITLYEDNPLTMEYIQDCLRLFNYDYIDHELTFFEEMYNKEKDENKKDNINHIIQFYEDLKGKNTKTAPLIRLGGNTGLLSKCIGLHMKNNYPNLYKQIYNDKNNPKKKKDNNNKNGEYPKVRQITPNNTAFGWCQLKSL